MFWSDNKELLSGADAISWNSFSKKKNLLIYIYSNFLLNIFYEWTKKSGNHIGTVKQIMIRRLKWEGGFFMMRGNQLWTNGNLG